MDAVPDGLSCFNWCASFLVSHMHIITPTATKPPKASPSLRVHLHVDGRAVGLGLSKKVPNPSVRGILGKPGPLFCTGIWSWNLGKEQSGYPLHGKTS